MLIFVSAEDNRNTLTAATRADMLATIKGQYGFMKLHGRNRAEAEAFDVFATPNREGAEKVLIGFVSRLD